MLSKRQNIIDNIIILVLTFASLGLVIYLSNTITISAQNKFIVILYFLLGAIIFALINAFIHELGHVISAKKNKFMITCFTVWFFKWTKRKNQFHFSFTKLGDEAGYTESIPTTAIDMEKRYKKVISGGFVASFIMLILSVIPLIFHKSLPATVFYILSMSLPISIYYFFDSFIPVKSEGLLNDGALYFSIKKGTNSSKVMINLLKIQAELYGGKSPKEIDEKLYFDLPQLPEDDVNFAFLLNARYNYYLDKGEYSLAGKTTERLISLSDYIPKSMMIAIKADELYNACTFMYNADKADEIMYELSPYLNKCNTATNVRIKLAYLTNVVRETDNFDLFYNKCKKEAKYQGIEGLKKFEEKLIDNLKESVIEIQKENQENSQNSNE